MVLPFFKSWAFSIGLFCGVWPCAMVHLSDVFTGVFGLISWLLQCCAVWVRPPIQDLTGPLLLLGCSILRDYGVKHLTLFHTLDLVTFGLSPRPICVPIPFPSFSLICILQTALFVVVLGAIPCRPKPIGSIMLPGEVLLSFRSIRHAWFQLIYLTLWCIRHVWLSRPLCCKTSG